MMDLNRDDPIEEERQEEQKPDVVPAIASEQPSVAAGIGTAFVGNDNDQESHVSPADNDGETVPGDQVDNRTGS